MVWQCERCERVSKNGTYDEKDRQHTAPENWRQFFGPVRGSEGARSQALITICDECDDALYDWLTKPVPIPDDRLGG